VNADRFILTERRNLGIIERAKKVCPIGHFAMPNGALPAATGKDGALL